MHGKLQATWGFPRGIRPYAVAAQSAGAGLAPPCTLGRMGATPYLDVMMRRFACALGALVLPAMAATAQRPVATLESLPPRAFVVLAMQAKAQDSIAARERDWRAWAAAEPASPGPRLALAVLSRFDLRYDEGRMWTDSAARLASAPRWRSAVARERIASLVVRGEFTGVDSLMRALLRDTVGLTRDERAEVLYASVSLQRRQTRQLNPVAVDSIALLASAADTFMQARLELLRAALDERHMVEHGERAITLARAANIPFVVGNAQLTLGLMAAGTGDMSAAIRWLMLAEQTARASHDDPTLAAALQWHGYALRTIGYVQSSRLRYTEAIRVSQRSNDRNIEAWALLGIAGSAREVGDHVTASSASRRAAMLFEATGDVLGGQNQKLELAQSQIMLGNLDEAERIARQSRAVGDSLRQPRVVLRSLYTLGDIALRRKQFAATTAYLDEAAPIATGLGVLWESQLDEYRGLVAQRRGQTRAAIEQLSRVRRGLAAGQDLYRYNVDGALALAWLTTGDSATSAKILVEANQRLDALRDTIAVSGLRKVVGAPQFWGATNDNIDLVMASLVQSRRWLPTVFTVTERTRARALLPGTLVSESLSDSAAIRASRRRVRANAVDLAQVQRSLKPGTALLVYAGGRASAATSLMVITSKAAQGFAIAPLDSLDREIVRWLALLESGEPGIGAGKRVSKAVLANALSALPASIKRLVIVPHGPLYRVPFQALPFGRGVLGDRVIVTIAPSVSLALTYAEAPRTVPSRVLALGAGDTPVQSATPQTLELNVERSERSNPLASLPAAGDEARAAASWGTGSTALTGAAASEGALKREARSGYTVLHAAAHALTSDQALGANYLILRADDYDDGYVSGGELAELSTGFAMVVLSGCRTTGDFGSSGDAIDGLVAPLLARGVRTVVASHWAVSDRWTKVLMERFYQNLAKGATTADAMNSAQTSLRRAGVPARFWAAFSVIGDGALTFKPGRT